MPIINRENLVIEKEKKFIDDTLSKIKLKNKQIEFQYKMTKKENLFKIFYMLKHNKLYYMRNKVYYACNT